MKKGEAEIAGCTDKDIASRLFKKRRNNIVKVFGLRKKDDVTRYVARREIKRGDKTRYKSPKVQRLITEKRVRRKKILKREKLDRFKTSKEGVAKYEKLLSQYVKEKKAARTAAAKKKDAPETKKWRTKSVWSKQAPFSPSSHRNYSLSDPQMFRASRASDVVLIFCEKKASMGA